MTAATGAGLGVRGSGCVAADLDGNGATDLLVTTAGYDVARDAYDALLWNDGHGRFTEGAWRAGIRAPGWHTGAAVADVNGDGRLDMFVAGYTDVNIPSPARRRGSRPTTPRCATCSTSTAAAPARHPTFREVGRTAGLEPRGLDHGLGASFVDVDRDGRLDLYVANDLDPNRLYLNVAVLRLPARVPSRRAREGGAGRRPERRDGHRRGRLLGRRPRRPLRDELARPAPRRVPQPRGRAVRRRAARLLRRARPALDGLGRDVGRPRSRRTPGARARERRDPGDEPRRERRAPPGRQHGERRRAAAPTSVPSRRGTVAGSRPPTSTTTATSTSPSARSAGGSSSFETTARVGTGSRWRFRGSRPERA